MLNLTTFRGEDKDCVICLEEDKTKGQLLSHEVSLGQGGAAHTQGIHAKCWNQAISPGNELCPLCRKHINPNSSLLEGRVHEIGADDSTFRWWAGYVLGITSASITESLYHIETSETERRIALLMAILLLAASIACFFKDL